MWKLKVINKIEDLKNRKIIFAHQALLNFLNDNNIEPSDCKIIHNNSESYDNYYEVYYKDKS